MDFSKFAWNETLSTGNDTLDMEHKHLLSIMIHFMESVERGNVTSMTDMISYLSSYVFDHFSLEERLMLNTNYPGFNEHRDDHSHYVKYVARLRQEMFITPKLIDEVTKELSTWFSNHILNVDKKMAEHIREFLNVSPNKPWLG